MCALLVMQEDPVCDAVQIICETCHYRYGCEYLSNGQFALCSKIISEIEEDYTEELNLNARLERCFDDMLRKSRKPSSRKS